MDMENIDLVPVIAGAVLLLFGWALYWIALNTAGALLFGAGGLMLCTWIGANEEMSGGALLALRAGGAVLGGVIGALFFQWVHKFAFFALGFLAGLGGAIAIVLAAREAGMEWAEPELMLWVGTPVAGLVMGLLATVLDKYVIAVVAATLGSALLWHGLGWPGGLWPLAVLIPLGAAFQVGVARMRKGNEEEED